MRLTAPDLNSRRSRLADWVELQALAGASERASISSIRSQFRMTTNERESPKEFDIDADDSGEPEITDRSADDLEEKVAEEIAFRESIIGSSYPFELVAHVGGRATHLQLKSSWSSTSSGELIYIFCLIDSGIRDGLIFVPKTEQRLAQVMGNIFQICACIAVGGYTRADVVSFGFPRANGNAFLPALQAAWERYGSYQVRQDIPLRI